ncbi:dipeptidase [Phycisphaerales bacterium AB-hyl4]|uniref:Dipeptidase n=1 Tax=Natronomicrosphaera hydrolytica TaxID=3242702 RepID=A0ABV4U1R5_9BACT
MPLMIDGHLDLAMNALLYERDQLLDVAALREREKRGVADDRGIASVSLPELRRAGVAVVMGTLISRCKPWVDASRPIARIDLDHPHPSMSYAMAHGQLAYYRQLESQGELRIITDGKTLDAHLSQWETIDVDPKTAPPPIGLVVLMEGADPIVAPEQLVQWHEQGLRVLGLAHYGHSRYAAGTPSRDPSSFEKDGPLTPLGVELLKQADELPMAVDLSHLSDASFYQTMDCYGGVVCASHTNCRTLANTPRQFSDRQIKLIVERGGVIGLAMYKGMIRWDDGDPPRAQVRLQHVIEHVDHICQLAGSAKHVALGTDLDGGFGVESTPADLDNYDDLHKLGPMMRERGMTDDDIADFYHGNWRRFLHDAMGAPTA